MREVLKEVRGALLSPLEELQSKAELAAGKAYEIFSPHWVETMSLIIGIVEKISGQVAGRLAGN
jgi:hypothetical protein